MGVELGKVHLDDFGDIHLLYHMLRFLPDYAAYRRENLVSSYWDLGNPLTRELNEADVPKRSPAAEEQLTIIGFMAFASFFEELDQVAPSDRSYRVVRAGFRAASEILLSACPVVTVEVLESEYGDSESKPGLPLFEVPRFIGDMLLRELSRLNGWIGARLGVDDQILKKMVKGGEVPEFYEKALDRALDTLLAIGVSE